MIKVEELPTAMPGKPGLTFFWYADMQVSDVLTDGWKMKSRDIDALRALREMMHRDHRAMQTSTWRRQYRVPAVARTPGLGLATIDDTDIFTRPTHYRVIWFAEAMEI